MTYPTQSHQTSATPRDTNLADDDIRDLPSPDDAGWGGPSRDAIPGREDVPGQEDVSGRADDTAPQTDGAGSAPAQYEPISHESSAPSMSENEQSANTRTENQETRRSPSDGQLSPGASADDPVAALWGTDLVQRYRDQWQQLQLRFVDDPRGATGEAAHLLDAAVQSLTTTLGDQKRALDGWQSAQGDDTEVLRTALTRYRDFLDRLLGL